MPYRTAAALGVFALLATSGNAHPQTDAITLIAPTAPVAQDSVSGLLKFRLRNLGEIDPAHPLASDNAGQTLSMFGREDLIAATSRDYRASRCNAAAPAVDPLAEIERGARATSIVIISESHERSEHRGFTARVAQRLRTLGYDTLAMEALTHNAPDLKPEFQAAFVRQPELPYLSENDGFYLGEAGFGRLGRTAKALGYRLLPYEIIHTGPPLAGETPAESINRREEAQARTLADFVKSHAGAKLLVHVGYDHAREVPTKKGDTWMAARLKAKTGIDPLTISQTVCRGGGKATRLSQPPAGDTPGAFDLIVDHPTARFVHGRPAWRLAAEDRPVAIPVSLRPVSGWRVIEARAVGEPDTSVPMDRVAIRAGETVALMLPRGRYQLRAIDVAFEPAPDKR